MWQREVLLAGAVLPMWWAGEEATDDAGALDAARQAVLEVLERSGVKAGFVCGATPQTERFAAIGRRTTVPEEAQSGEVAQLKERLAAATCHAFSTTYLPPTSEILTTYLPPMVVNWSLSGHHWSNFGCYDVIFVQQKEDVLAVL